ncbi:MAG TPA: Mur ligase [Limnobacter sp.]|nr:Mur ligase [Limnobacter sp.]
MQLTAQHAPSNSQAPARVATLVQTILQRQIAGNPQVVFISTSNGDERARVERLSGSNLQACLAQLEQPANAALLARMTQCKHLRVDIPQIVSAITMQELDPLLAKYKRNYFPHGLAWDDNFSQALLCEELLANAIVYPGPNTEHAQLNEANLKKYVKLKWGSKAALNTGKQQVVHVFNTHGFYSAQDGQVIELHAEGTAHGTRHREALTAEACMPLIHSASEYLARQVKDDGTFVYGQFPCFGQPVAGYNTLRHASSLYAMLEALEVTHSKALDEAILRALRLMVSKFIKVHRIGSNNRLAFLVDVGDEVKLGGNAVALLALCKYTQLKQDLTYMPLMKDLANGIAAMQNQSTGQFVHVLNYPSTTVKEQFRIIYYDGEAAFAMMRMHELMPKLGCIRVVEKAFEYFLKANHAKAHDHWLSYCVNELTRHKPKAEYFQFGIHNVKDHLDFVQHRITTFPTLLELMMAAHHMIQRMQALPEHRALLDQIDTRQFYNALHHRANYLLTGYFWPELSMFFHAPDSIEGSFFIRHHSFRVRIDDIEHYLSGLIAYRQALLSGTLPAAQPH